MGVVTRCHPREVLYIHTLTALGYLGYLGDVSRKEGTTMYRPCSACGGSGFEEYVDHTLPPPPCRLCRPEEAQRHLMLARDTRHVAASQRAAAYHLLREGGALALS